MGYYSATGKTGVASVTCGPGVTQITTILSTAVRARVPLVVFAGESPMNAKWYNQAIEQAPLVNATGAHYVRAHSAKLMHEYVREAFYTARYERRPTVLGVPYDLQKQTYVGLVPITSPRPTYIPQPGRTLPSPEAVARLVDKIASAKKPIIIAGRGAVASGARLRSRRLPRPPARCSRPRCPRRGMFDATLIPWAWRAALPARVARELFARGRPRDRDRREPHILHCRRRQPVPEGRMSRRSTSGRSACATAIEAGDLFLKADAKAGRRGRDRGADSGAASRTPAIARKRLRKRSRPRRSIRSRSRSRPAPSIRAP